MAKTPQPDAGNAPACHPCRLAAGTDKPHTDCVGCTGCGCAMSARWSHHMSDPRNRV